MVLVDVEKLMEETDKHYEGKMDKLYRTIRNYGNIIRKLEEENKDLRKEKARLIREKKKNEKPHLRKGQKRGKHGRNG